MNHFIEELIESCKDFETYKQSDAKLDELKICEDYDTVSVVPSNDTIFMNWYNFG